MKIKNGNPKSLNHLYPNPLILWRRDKSPLLGAKTFLSHYYEVGGSLKYYRYQAIKICVNYGITKSQIKNREILDQFYAILIIFLL